MRNFARMTYGFQHTKKLNQNKIKILDIYGLLECQNKQNLESRTKQNTSFFTKFNHDLDIQYPFFDTYSKSLLSNWFSAWPSMPLVKN